MPPTFADRSCGFSIFVLSSVHNIPPLISIAQLITVVKQANITVAVHVSESKVAYWSWRAAALALFVRANKHKCVCVWQCSDTCSERHSSFINDHPQRAAATLQITVDSDVSQWCRSLHVNNHPVTSRPIARSSHQFHIYNKIYSPDDTRPSFQVKDIYAVSLVRFGYPLTEALVTLAFDLLKSKCELPD